MNAEIPMANPPLSAEEASMVEKLSDADFREIDAAILANASDRWLKVARVVCHVEEALKGSYPQLSYIFYALRLIQLAEKGRLESRGNLKHMRFSEVRKPS